MFLGYLWNKWPKTKERAMRFKRKFITSELSHCFWPKIKVLTLSRPSLFTLTLGRKFFFFLVQDRNHVILKKKSVYRVESRYNEPLYNEVIGITNNVLYLRNSKVYTLFYKNVHFSSWVWTVLIFLADSDWKCSSGCSFKNSLIRLFSIYLLRTDLSDFRYWTEVW